MDFILVSVVAGLLGTSGMTAFLWLVDRSGWTNADMVRALGSAVTRSYETALAPGLAIHFGIGIPIAMLYVVALDYLPFHAVGSAAATGGLIAVLHGFSFSFMLVVLAERHPVEEFREAEFKVALAHFLGHLVYGVLVGFVAGASGYFSD